MIMAPRNQKKMYWKSCLSKAIGILTQEVTRTKHTGCQVQTTPLPLIARPLLESQSWQQISRVTPLKESIHKNMG